MCPCRQALQRYTDSQDCEQGKQLLALNQRCTEQIILSWQVKNVDKAEDKFLWASKNQTEWQLPLLQLLRQEANTFVDLLAMHIMVNSQKHVIGRSA